LRETKRARELINSPSAKVEVDLKHKTFKGSSVPHCVNSPIGNFAVAAKVRSEGPHRGMTEGSSMSAMV